ncbi:unnamed protein product [Parnassius apollo]|uniref:(apollo) hypothetical protein n=1 Tax=Parnassius apollo TaxID=110799 RepID=A0A8S3YEW7_PARAO|nr:unnamed protein product [Parnassius apollo]
MMTSLFFDSKLVFDPRGSNDKNSVKNLKKYYKDGSVEIAKLLLRWVADPDWKDKDGKKPIDLVSPYSDVGKLFGAIDYNKATSLVAVALLTTAGSIALISGVADAYIERIWLQEKIENQTYTLSSQDKKEVLRHLIESKTFEQILHVKFPGYKRFSIEGGELAIVAIERIISDSAAFGIEEVVLGMAHRGRLNVLTKVMGKEYAAMLSEFQGNLAYPSGLEVSGDVKYHLGYSSDRALTSGKKINLSLCPNPSHLEAVNPVLAGRIRAKQNIRSVLGISIHGDAAFIGQGVVAETLSLSNINNNNNNSLYLHKTW